MKEYIWVNGALMLIDPILHPFYRNAIVLGFPYYLKFSYQGLINSATTVLRRLKYVHYKVLAIQYTIKCLVINKCNGNGTNPPTI